MRHLFKLICAFVLVSLLINPYAASGAGPKNPGRSSSATKQFLSGNHEGLIGVTTEVPVDNPADNIFHVNVDEALCGEEKVWLVYDLEGVEDHTAVSRSINDQVAVGGYLVKKRKGWATQREQINAGWLKEGDNIVRFTMPENAGHNYRIRDLRFEVEPSVENNNNEVQIIFNQPSLHYFFDKAYIKGFVSGAGYEDVSIKVDGREARIFNGEFEAVVDFVAAQGSCSIEVEAIYPDGTSTCHSVLFSEPGTPDYQYTIDHYTYRSEKFFDSKKDETLSLNGAVLHHTADALEVSSILSITSLRVVDIPALDGGMVNVTKDHAGFRFLPHGMVFSKEVNISLPFDPEAIPDGYTEKDIRTYYFDEQSHHWVPLALDTVLMEKGEVVSKTIHFTDMINGIIKVPEAPEAEAYNSTSMKGIKAANPTAAVNLINPPQANNTGNASLGYGINIPAGRAGMQPQLSISYNSGGGNGWMGLGWNLSMPMISIDTRWGVPRYDPVSETETYTMNGEQLTPVAHRATLEERSTGDKQFYPRIEGAFNKIIRHGDKPRNYWWEVTDKSGTRYFYGGSPSGFDEEAVLRTKEDGDAEDKGNVAQWCLREVRDLNGNTVRYHYVKVPDTGLAEGKVIGYQIYIEKIHYTGYQGSDGPYLVTFSRESREDKIISANLGFKQVTGERLKRIDVKMDVTPIRSYELSYITGEFHKSLLEKITEYDAAGEVFNNHTFEYYNEVRNKDTFKPLTAPDQWRVPGDTIHGGFKTNIDGFKDEATALSGTKSKDKNVGVTISVGVGFDFFSKGASAGVSGGYSESESEGLLVMMDMNGDGLQDKVFSKNGKLSYRPNLLARTGEPEFGETPIEIKSDGISTFYKEKSKTTSYGAEASFVAFVGYSHNKTKSKVSTYFSDVNGDQLPDIVQNGVVYFNHLDPQTGVITYSRGSEGTPNRIYSSGPVSTDLLDKRALEEDRQRAIEQNPLLDIVRMWKAPYSGTISITSPVQLLESNDRERADAPADGVRVWIQLREQVLWRADIEGNDYGEHNPAGLNNLNVNKGDMVFFRVGSRDHGAYDSVRWEPVIEYTDKTEGLTDANGRKVYRFSAAEDFILSSEQTVNPPFNGKILVTGDFHKPRTTDDVQVFIIREVKEDNVVDTVWRRNFVWHEEVPAFPDTTLEVKSNETYRLKVVSGTNIDWNALAWRPKLVYVSTENPDINLSNTPIEVSPVVEYSLFVNTLGVAKPFMVELDSAGQRDTLEVSPLLKFIEVPFDASYTSNVRFQVRTDPEQQRSEWQ